MTLVFTRPLSLADMPILLIGLGALLVALLLAIWWRQHTFRWPLVVVTCLVAAPALSWWSGHAFVVADYRAGCDGLCSGFRGAPIAFFQGETAGAAFLPGMFAISALVYLALLLAWTSIIYAFAARGAVLGRIAGGGQALLTLVLFAVPFALSPFFLPPPEAHVRGDSLRIAINAEREVYMYDQKAGAPVLRVGLEDVRPRSDRAPGMRVCLRTYTFFYVPTGYMFLDMAPEGVHSTAGGIVPNGNSCWD